VNDNSIGSSVNCSRKGFFKNSLPAAADSNPIDRTKNNRFFRINLKHNATATQRRLNTFCRIIRKGTAGGRRGIDIERSESNLYFLGIFLPDYKRGKYEQNGGAK